MFFRVLAYILSSNGQPFFFIKTENDTDLKFINNISVIFKVNKDNKINWTAHWRILFRSLKFIKLINMKNMILVESKTSVDVKVDHSGQ